MTLAAFLQHHRGVHNPCKACRGLGVLSYGSTATWRGGMGGSMMTRDVCDRCWGSGDQDEPWTDLRRLRNEERQRIAEGAATLFAERCGVAFRCVRPGLRELVGELERFARGRKPRADGFDTACLCLATLLTELCDAAETGAKP
jgi:hypothetical protein